MHVKEWAQQHDEKPLLGALHDLENAVSKQWVMEMVFAAKARCLGYISALFWRDLITGPEHERFCQDILALARQGKPHAVSP
ncbi:hypothetical protein A6D6_04113 [Alcanivorax xiamenensis]|uniref:Uncharacterized protein n=1 Tax=Alcanivorax xiamenensis TaxID=1177156 RepID=A0ABQ6Y3B3_9GAMM|nr:hypothetical protein [Alcanivorax xiamenensis]KAF0802200.1 hypothetical protein A6D6_04113 [Alcanivorax xiamenensis]